MNSVAKQLLLNVDSMLLAAPAITTLGVGVGFRQLEHKQHPALKTIGFIGTRVCAVLAVGLSGPLLVWNAVKAIFAKMLDGITAHRFASLNLFAKDADRTFKVVLAFVGGIPNLVLNLPEFHKSARFVQNAINAISAMAQKNGDAKVGERPSVPYGDTFAQSV